MASSKPFLALRETGQRSEPVAVGVLASRFSQRIAFGDARGIPRRRRQGVFGAAARERAADGLTYRDPPAPKTTNLSNAIELTVGP
jgi:hypothetical protein